MGVRGLQNKKPLPEKAAVMQSFGVDGLCVTTFTRARANQSPEDFMAELVEVYAPVVIVCGFNFTFGAGGKGNGIPQDHHLYAG